MTLKDDYSDDLQHECTELVRDLMRKHACLQPDNAEFDVWSRYGAVEIVADLIILINQSGAIQNAHTARDFGK